ncbi:MAG: glycosyltransferase family 4 protein [Actinomycetota bacterium]|nr:glycosyltransferase family 4 protein [Actinomycetota bacterium]
MPEPSIVGAAERVPAWPGAGNANRAVIVVPDFHATLGGTVRQATNHARGLAALGMSAQVVTRRYKGAWSRHEVVQGITVRRFGFPGRGALSEKASLVSLWWWLAMRRNSFAMVQTIMYSDFAIMAALAGLRPKTIVIWAAQGEASDVLGPARDPLRQAQRLFRRRVLKGCRQVALTPSIEEELRGLGLRHCTVIPVPVDGSRFRVPHPDERAAARRRLGLGERELTFIYAGRFDTDKGLDRLAEAVAAVVAAGFPARLVLVGGGEVDALRAALRSSGMESLTILPGVVDDVETYLWASDVFVLPSVREGLSNSLAEAMSCGLACVAAPEAGGDQVLYGGAGLVPASASTADLTEALLRLAGDETVRCGLGERAVARATIFAADRVASTYSALLGG